MNKRKIVHQFSEDAKEWLKRNKMIDCKNCPLSEENHKYMLVGQSLCSEKQFNNLNNLLGTNYIFDSWSCIDLVSALIDGGENYKCEEEELE